MRKSTLVFAALLCICGLQLNAAESLEATYTKIFRPVSTEALKDLKTAGILNLGYALHSAAASSPATCQVVTVANRPVLRLVSHGDAAVLKGSQFAKLRIIEDTKGYNNVRIGMEFALNDAAENRPQLLMMAVIGASATSDGYVACVRFATDRIEILTPRPNKPASAIIQKIPYEIGTGKFHALVLQASGADGVVRVFKEGETAPIATTKMPTAKGYATAINFGDAASDIFGSADIAYFAWKLE